MGTVLFGEVLIFGGPIVVGIVLFYFLGRYLSGLMLFTVLAVFPFIAFSIASLMFPAPFDQIDVVLQVIVTIGVLIGAVIGAIVAVAVNKFKRNKQDQ